MELMSPSGRVQQNSLCLAKSSLLKRNVPYGIYSSTFDIAGLAEEEVNDLSAPTTFGRQ